MYNMIHANQQDIHWKKCSLFSVYLVVHCLSSSASIYKFNKGGFTVSKNQCHIK